MSANIAANSLQALDYLIEIFAVNRNPILSDNHRVLMFKQYSKEYAEAFHTADIVFQPVFDFEYITDELSSLMVNESELSSYSGVIITSPRSVHALHRALSVHHIDPSSFPLPIPIYTFGSRTPALVSKTLPKCQCVVFRDATDSKMMASSLIQRLEQQNCDRMQIPPLLVLFGERHRMELVSKLSDHGIAYRGMVVYRTVDRMELKALKDLDYRQTQCCWIFFSPNGVDVVMRYLKRMDIHDLKQHIICGAIGPTTARRLQEVQWDASFVAAKPNAQSLYEAWRVFVNHE